MTFRDRTEAGRLLGQRLRDERLDRPVVLGLPRGGVIVASEVADALGAPLDLVVARKLGVPWQPELAFGAVAPDAVALRDDVIRAAGLDQEDVDAAIARERALLGELAERYRAGTARVPLDGRTAVIVDDGLATGATATAAVRSVRREAPGRVIVAVPVAASATARALRSEADAVVTLGEFADFRAVGQYYRDFGQVSDGDVRSRLERAHRAPAGR